MKSSKVCAITCLLFITVILRNFKGLQRNYQGLPSSRLVICNQCLVISLRIAFYTIIAVEYQLPYTVILVNFHFVIRMRWYNVNLHCVQSPEVIILFCIHVAVIREITKYSSKHVALPDSYFCCQAATTKDRSLLWTLNIYIYIYIYIYICICIYMYNIYLPNIERRNGKSWK